MTPPLSSYDEYYRVYDGDDDGGGGSQQRNSAGGPADVVIGRWADGADVVFTDTG